jgi:hypothetical protein
LMKLNTNIVFPEYVYHGTVIKNLPNLMKQLLNSYFWNPTKDFGAGLYTTISLEQAKSWAIKQSKDPGQQPCVLQIRCMSHLLLEEHKALIFLGECKEWSDFILDHRVRGSLEFDPCEHYHPDIIIGLMADNDTGAIVEQFKENRESKDWFYQQICLSREENRKLDGLELGNQIVFCTEKVSGMLKLIGYHELESKGEWRYHEISGDIQEINR